MSEVRHVSIQVLQLAAKGLRAFFERQCVGERNCLEIGHLALITAVWTGGADTNDLIDGEIRRLAEQMLQNVVDGRIGRRSDQGSPILRQQGLAQGGDEGGFPGTRRAQDK